jgi:O-antigen/teichoic acid export membrane protein
MLGELLFKKFFKSQLRVNMLSGVFSTVINVIVTAVSYPVYLHFLGYERYGVWIVLYTIINFAQLSHLGIAPAVMKLVAEEHGQRNTDGIQNYANTALFVTISSGTIALLIILYFKTSIIGLFNLNGENAYFASLLLPYMATLSIYVFIVQTFGATLSGIGRMDLTNYSESFGRVISLCVSSILLFQGFGIVSLFFGNAISYIFVHIGNYYFLRKIIKIQFWRPRTFSLECLTKILRFGGGVLGGSLISMFLGPFNKLVLSRWLGVASVSVYEIAFNGSMQVRALFEAGFRALTPEVSKISISPGNDAKERLHSINKRALTLIWKFGGPVWLIIIIFMSPLLKLWLRDRFTDALPIEFQIILFGTFLSLLGVPAFYILMGLGKTKQIFIGFLIQSFANSFCIIVVLISPFEITNNTIAISVLTGMGFSTFYLALQRRKFFGELPT